MEDNVRPTHDMVIRPEYYDLVVNGTKIYEARTNDERRQAMQIGDRICLRRLATPEEEAAGITPTDYIMLVIEDKIPFDDFTQLYDSLPKSETGFEGRETDEIIATEIRKFYSPEKERENGVVAIKVRREENLERKLRPGIPGQK